MEALSVSFKALYKDLIPAQVDGSEGAIVHGRCTMEVGNKKAEWIDVNNRSKAPKIYCKQQMHF
jgi:hypothetical protein